MIFGCGCTCNNQNTTKLRIHWRRCLDGFTTMAACHDTTTVEEDLMGFDHLPEDCLVAVLRNLNGDSVNQMCRCGVSFVYCHVSTSHDA